MTGSAGRAGRFMESGFILLNKRGGAGGEGAGSRSDAEPDEFLKSLRFGIVFGIVSGTRA